MLRALYLKMENRNIGAFVEKDEKVLGYYPFKDWSDKLPEMIGYPPGLFKYERRDGRFRPVLEKWVGRENVLSWIESRIFPEDRQDSDILLGRLNLSEYDSWEIFKRIGGVSAKDRYRIGNTFVLMEKTNKSRPRVYGINIVVSQALKARKSNPVYGGRNRILTPYHIQENLINKIYSDDIKNLLERTRLKYAEIMDKEEHGGKNLKVVKHLIRSGKYDNI